MRRATRADEFCVWRKVSEGGFLACAEDDGLSVYMFCTDGRVMGGENCVFADWKSLNFNSKEIECVYPHVAHKFHYL